MGMDSPATKVTPIKAELLVNIAVAKKHGLYRGRVIDLIFDDGEYWYDSPHSEEQIQIHPTEFRRIVG